MTDTPKDPRSGFDRLVGADPEQDTPSPDLSSQREHLLALVAEVPPRRRGPLIAAGVAAAVALVAGSTLGGIAIGNANPSGASAAVATPASGAPQEFGLGDAIVDWPPQSGPSGIFGIWTAASRSQVAGAPYFDVSYADFVPGSSVSDQSPGTARGYRFDATGVVPKDVAINLARVFGIEATPKRMGPTWTVSEARRSSAVHVTTNGDISWQYFHHIAHRKQQCKKEDTACQKNPPRPDRAKVEAQARALFAQLGVTADVEWETYDNSWGGRVDVVAWQVMDGVRTPAGWQFEYSVDGLETVNGFSAALVSAGDYPVVSPKEAIERSALTKWRRFGPNQIRSNGAAYLNFGVNPDQPIPTQTRDGVSVVRAPMTTVTLDGGAPTILTYWQSNAETLLLPGYRFSGSQGTTWAVISVAESAVDFGQ